MKWWAIIAAVIVVVLGACGFLKFHFHRSSPEGLLERLRKAGPQDRENVMMRLNVARGDVVGLLITALAAEDAPASFRCDVLELLLKANLRVQQDRIDKAILAALDSTTDAVRRKAAYGLAAYGQSEQQAALAGRLDDPDPAVRRQAYMVMGSGSGRRMERGAWGALSREQKEKAISVCRRRAKAEDDPELRTLARAVIGKAIEWRAEEATQALQSSDVVKAEEVFRAALAMDPENHQAQVRLARFLLKHGDRDEALKQARRFGALIEVPTLSHAPKIDGDPTDEVWAEAWTTETFYHSTSRWIARPCKGKSRAFLGHKDGKIYVAVMGYEKDLKRLVRKTTARDGPTYYDDCVELIFDPRVTGTEHYQFVVNCVGAVFDRASKGGRSRNFKCEYAAKIFFDRGYWALEFALDGKELDGAAVKPGEIWGLNVFRVRIGAASEHGVIWPTFGWAHRMDLYPIALFK